jgi:ferrous iron transport protein A
LKMAPPSVPVTFLSPGEEGEIVEVRGGRGLVKRLAGMGLVRGVRVTMVQWDTSGPLILAVSGSRIALGRGMAVRIMVRPVLP